MVFGEIGARPPGGRTVDVMNYVTDDDLFRGLGRGGRPRPDVAPARAPLQRGQHLQAGRGIGSHLPHRRARATARASTATRWPPSTCCRSGAPRRDWRATLISDGMVIVRHPELGPLIEMADRFAGELRLYAG